MCLAHLLRQYTKLFDPDVEIHTMTIDHGYRQNSRREATRVGNIMESWGFFHHLHSLTYDKEVSAISNFEEVARYLRYQTFQKKCLEHGIDSILVAHNLNDRLETFVQRLQMNSTLFGLGGLRPKVGLPISPASPNEIMVYRPLLRFDKGQIRETCLQDNVLWFEDPTNADRNLTKRNLHRFMINEYIPVHVSKNPKLEIVSKEKLSKTISAVDDALLVLEKCIFALDGYIRRWGSFKFDRGFACLSFSAPLNFWDSLQDPVSARWLYHIISPISSAKHLHWSYAKLERLAMPRIKQFIRGEEKLKIFTYLNVVFRLTKKEGFLHFHLSKQPPERNVIKALNNTVSVPSPWILIDKTWWIRVNSAVGNGVDIKLYSPKQKKQLLKAFPHVVPGRLKNIPVIIANDEIVAIPTLRLAKDGYSVDYAYKA